MSKQVFAPGERDSRLKFVSDEVALDGSNPTVIDLAGYFTKILGFVATYKGNVTPGDGHSILTYDIVGTKVNVYAWVHAAADPTLQASAATATFTYVAFGY
jgi:hypothetical protein